MMKLEFDYTPRSDEPGYLFAMFARERHYGYTFIPDRSTANIFTAAQQAREMWGGLTAAILEWPV